MTATLWDFANSFQIRAYDRNGVMLGQWAPTTGTYPTRCGPIETVEIDQFERELKDGTRRNWIRGYRRRFTVEWHVHDIEVQPASGYAYYPVQSVLGLATGGGYLMITADSGYTWKQANIVSVEYENMEGKNTGLMMRVVFELSELGNEPTKQHWSWV